jgi:hypothetical protein
MGMLFTRSIGGVTVELCSCRWKEGGGREVGRTMCGAEMVASWPIDLVKVLGDNTVWRSRHVLWRVFISVPFIEHVISTIDRFHRL